jgi:hypothetical protein
MRSGGADQFFAGNLVELVASRTTSKRRCGGEKAAQGSVLLLANTEFLDNVLVTLGIVALEVIEQAATLAHHHQETAAGGVILRVRFEVVRQFTDSFAKHCDLDLGTPGVTLVCAVSGDDVLFALSG